MKTRFLHLILVWLVAFMILGCDSKTKQSTPEDGVQAFFKGFASFEPNKHIENFSQKSMVDQNISKEDILKAMTESFNVYKSKKFTILDYKIISLHNITPDTVYVEVNVTYKMGDEKEEIEKNRYIFVNENGSWKYSIQNYIKKETIAKKCGESKKIKICIDEILYYSNQIYLQGTIENNSNQVHRFGFGASSVAKLTDNKGVIASSSYPKLGSNISPDIAKGSSNIGFSVDVDPSLMVKNFQPINFSVDNVIPMNGELPSGFDNEFAISVQLH